MTMKSSSSALRQLKSQAVMSRPRHRHGSRSFLKALAWGVSDAGRLSAASSSASAPASSGIFAFRRSQLLAARDFCELLMQRLAVGDNLPANLADRDSASADEVLRRRDGLSDFVADAFQPVD